MRISTMLFVAALSIVPQTGVAWAAGLRLVEVPSSQGKPSIRAAFWSPCAAAPIDTRIGPFVLPAVRDCDIAEGKYPLVVISHGFEGTYLSHRDTATALADAGFLVVAINHPGDSALDMTRAGEVSALTERPSDMIRLLDHLLGDWTVVSSMPIRLVSSAFRVAAIRRFCLPVLLPIGRMPRCRVLRGRRQSAPG